MKYLYRYHNIMDSEGLYDVEGLFLATSKEIEDMIGTVPRFGRFIGIIEGADVTLVTKDQNEIKQIVSLLGGDLIGYNPLKYLGDA